MTITSEGFIVIKNKREIGKMKTEIDFKINLDDLADTFAEQIDVAETMTFIAKITDYSFGSEDYKRLIKFLNKKLDNC